MGAVAAATTGRRLPVWARLAEERADANKLLRVFEVEYPPIDSEVIAKRMGIEVLPEPPGTDISGRIDVDFEAPRAVIHVRRDHAPWRQRFTIAHEIGHLLLGHTETSATCYRMLGSGPNEPAANRFAADLLMPLWLLEPLVMKHGADTGFLAHVFGVSADAMSVRLSVLTGIRR